MCLQYWLTENQQSCPKHQKGLICALVGEILSKFSINSESFWKFIQQSDVVRGCSIALWKARSALFMKSLKTMSPSSAVLEL